VETKTPTSWMPLR